MSHFDTFYESALRPITIGEPRNSFERDVLESYDRCRAEALYKYFPMLSNAKIKQLLRDNYLQRNDLKRFLYKK